MDLTFELKIGPKLEDWFLKLEVFSWVEIWKESDATLVPLHFFIPFTSILVWKAWKKVKWCLCDPYFSSFSYIFSLGPKFLSWPIGSLDFGGWLVLDSFKWNFHTYVNLKLQMSIWLTMQQFSDGAGSWTSSNQCKTICVCFFLLYSSLNPIIHKDLWQHPSIRCFQSRNLLPYCDSPADTATFLSLGSSSTWSGTGIMVQKILLAPWVKTCSLRLIESTKPYHFLEPPPPPTKSHAYSTPLIIPFREGGLIKCACWRLVKALLDFPYVMKLVPSNYDPRVSGVQSVKVPETFNCKLVLSFVVLGDVSDNASSNLQTTLLDFLTLRNRCLQIMISGVRESRVSKYRKLSIASSFLSFVVLGDVSENASLNLRTKLLDFLTLRN